MAVVRSPETTETCSGPPEIMIWLSGQPKIKSKKSLFIIVWSNPCNLIVHWLHVQSALIPLHWSQVGVSDCDSFIRTTKILADNQKLQPGCTWDNLFLFLNSDTFLACRVYAACVSHCCCCCCCCCSCSCSCSCFSIRTWKINVSRNSTAVKEHFVILPGFTFARKLIFKVVRCYAFLYCTCITCLAKILQVLLKDNVDLYFIINHNHYHKFPVIS